MAGAGCYQGGNRFLRWWPKALLGLALLILVVGWNHSVQFAALLAVSAYIHGRWLPWQFTATDEGLALSFPFGRRLFLAKSALTVRLEVVGAIALVGRRRRFGYPLMERVLYEPGHEQLLHTVFTDLGYRVSSP